MIGQELYLNGFIFIDTPETNNFYVDFQLFPRCSLLMLFEKKKLIVSIGLNIINTFV